MVSGCISAGVVGSARTEEGLAGGWTIDIDTEFFTQMTISIASLQPEDSDQEEALLFMVMLPRRKERFDRPVNDGRWAIALRSGTGDVWGTGAGIGYKAGLEAGKAQLWIRPMAMLWLGEEDDAFDPALELTIQTGVGF